MPSDGLQAKDGLGALTIVATDYITDRHYQIVKVAFGDADTATMASATNPLPVSAINVAPSGRLTDGVAAFVGTDVVMGLVGGVLTAYPIKFAKIVASASGPTTVVPFVASKKIRVLGWDLVCNAAVNVKWQSHVTPTDLTGLYYFGANGGKESSPVPQGRFETVAGEALDINLSGAVAVGGSLVYIEV